jgi:hypothetical protein
MLVLKHEMDLYDFRNEFRDEFKDLPDEAIIIIFNSLCEMMFEGDYSIMHVRDYLRFQMRVSSLDEVIGDYSIDIDAEDDADAKIETVEKYLNYNTYLLGTFEDDGEMYFIFDEF